MISRQKRILRLIGYAFLSGIYLGTRGPDTITIPIGMLLALYLVGRHERPNDRKVPYIIALAVGLVSMFSGPLYALLGKVLTNL